MSVQPEETTAVVTTVTVRYFAGARAAVGLDSEPVTLGGSTPSVQDLIATLTQRHGGALARVLPACSFLVDEVSGSRDRLLSDGARVDVLPPFAGG